MRFPISRGTSQRAANKSPPAGRGSFLSRKKAKTSGPARGLANNANACDGEGRFHRRSLSPLWPVAVKSHQSREKRPAWSARRKRKILLNMSIHDRGKPGQNRDWRHDFVLFEQHQPSIGSTTSGNTMQQIKKQTDRAQYVQLVDQYRAIGPAALVAALLHTSKKRKTSIASKAA
jgi:hypothetical protein